MIRHKSADEQKSVRAVPIVALGASAGGLEPIEQFFDAVAPDSGAAFVVIQHLSPDFDSMMEELLSRHSKMPIVQAADDLEIAPNTIFLNPPRTNMCVQRGRFRLTNAPPGNQLNLPINAFFESLAKEYETRAIGIVLSGTGSDGTLGARAIKRVGGHILAQEPSSTKFPGMPSSVIDGGLADAVAAPTMLFDLVQKLRAGISVGTDEHAAVDFGNPIVAIFTILRQRFGTEFGYYKEATILRRLDRRIRQRNISIDDYAALLKVDKVETAALYADLLVEVTEFFRDKEAFEVVKQRVVPHLVENMSATEPIRVWVPGCASGEEAYSLAILIADCAHKAEKSLNLKIFATDIHNRSLSAASKGIFKPEDLSQLSEEQIERHFTVDGLGYQVNQSIRSTVVFSAHNVLKDPPFTRMNFISCRNLLIYFNDVAQHKALALFHASLPKDGFLFLGPSESTNKIGDEFGTVSQKWRVFRKKNDSRLPEASTLLPANLGAATVSSPGADTEPSMQRVAESSRSNLPKEYQSALEHVVREYAPPGFLLTGDGEVLHVFGDAAAALNLSAGQFSSNIVNLVDPRLRDVVSNGLRRLRGSHDQPFERRVRLDEETISVAIRWVGSEPNSETSLLLTLQTIKDMPQALASPSLPAGDKAQFNVNSPELLDHIRDLEADLVSTENSLKATVESFETSNEELQASNEELMASNEELQSTNEELHSVNEELFTVSAEHQRKIDELTELTDDMNHLFDATDIGVIFLDSESCVRRFTPAAQLTFNLLPHDMGRPIGHITTKFQNIDLKKLVDEVRSDGKQRQQEITVDGNGFVLRVLPYAGSEGAVGEVITIVDISEVKNEQAARLQMSRQYEEIVSDITEVIVRWHPDDGTILYCNRQFQERTAFTQEQILGKKIHDVSEMVGSLLDKVGLLGVGKSVRDIAVQHTPNEPERFVSLHARAIGDTDGKVIAYQAVGRDVTDEQRYLHALEAMAETAETAGDDDNALLNGLLRVGNDYLNLPMGVISRFTQDKGIVQFVTQWSPSLTPGDELPIEQTVSSLITDAEKFLAIPHFSQSQYADHESFKKSGFESYLGTRVVTVGGSAKAILAFASFEPRVRVFSSREIAFADLLARTVGTILDRLEEFDRLASDRAFYRETYIRTPAMMCTLDATGNIIEVTDEWELVLGHTRQGVVGTRFEQYVTTASCENFQQALGADMFCNTYRKLPGELCTASGNTIQAEVSSIARNALDTGDKQFLLLIDDISERASALGEIERQKAVLEQSNESLTQFAYIASHDFQEPLRKIRQFADLLVNDYGDQFDDDGKYYLNVMTDAATRISGLVTDLLEFSRASNQPIASAPIELNSLVADLRAEFASYIEASGAKISVGDLPTVVGDKAATHQLFQNLISNALKYHRPNEPAELLIASNQRGNQTLLHFSDKGIGIDTGAEKSIFEPFVRLQHRTDFEGTGIGLAICKAVCDRLGWTLSYTSKANEGTIFTVSLPTPKPTVLSSGKSGVQTVV